MAEPNPEKPRTKPATTVMASATQKRGFSTAAANSALSGKVTAYGSGR